MKSVRPPAITLLLLTLLAVGIIGLDLGASSLHNQDEALHAVVAREAATQGNWLPLTYRGQTYFNKPPLRIWLTALTFRVAGVSETTVRFWSAFFGVATVLVLYLLGRRLYGERTAVLAALILLTSHQYLYNHCVRTGETDAMLIFFWTSGLLALQLAVRDGHPRLLYLAAAALGLCGMVKHLGFVPIVLTVAIGYVLLAGQARAFPARIWATALGVVAAVALPWHLIMRVIEGPVFTQRYLLGEVVEKRLEARGGGPSLLPTGPWSSLVTLSRGFFPWSLLLPFALLSVAWRGDFRRRWLMPVLWFAVAMAVTVVSGRKLSWYVLPAFPAAAILVGALLDRFLADDSSIWIRLSVAVGSLAALTSLSNAARHNPFEVMAREAMLGVFFLGRLRETLPTSAALGAFALLVVVAALVYRSLQRLPRPQRLRRTARQIVVAALLLLACYTVIVPLQYRRTQSPLARMAAATDNHRAPGEPLNVLLRSNKARNPRFHYYFGHHDPRIRSRGSLRFDELAGELLLIDNANLQALRDSQPGAPSPVEALARARGMLLFRLPAEP